MKISFVRSMSYIFGVTLGLGLGAGSGCDSDPGKARKNNSSPQSPAPAPAPAPAPEPKPDPAPSPVDNLPPSTPNPPVTTPPVDTGAWDPGPGIEGCARQGKVWVAINKDGGPGYCGESEAQMCCTEAEISSRFSAVPSLAANLQKAKATGAKLYQCSTDGSGKTVFHFAGLQMAGVVYQFLGVNQATPAGAPPANCPRPTLADLGFSSVLSGTNTGSGTSTRTGP